MQLLFRKFNKKKLDSLPEKPMFAVCRNVCRGPNVGHTAKAWFAVCHENKHTVKVQHTAKTIYAVRQAKRPMVNLGHTAKHHESLPCA